MASILNQLNQIVRCHLLLIFFQVLSAHCHQNQIACCHQWGSVISFQFIFEPCRFCLFLLNSFWMKLRSHLHCHMYVNIKYCVFADQLNFSLCMKDKICVKVLHIMLHFITFFLSTTFHLWFTFFICFLSSPLHWVILFLVVMPFCYVCCHFCCQFSLRRAESTNSCVRSECRRVYLH